MKLAPVLLLLVLLPAVAGRGATKNPMQPDREMLSVMELLQHIEIIKQVEMLQEMQNLESAGHEAKTAPGNRPPLRKRETVK
jgi:hypothetical protein